MLSFFPRDVLAEIWDLIWSVSEGFPFYSCNAGKVPIHFKSFYGGAHTWWENICFFRVIVRFAIMKIVLPVENKLILPDSFK